MTAIFDESVPRDLLPLLHRRGCDVVDFPKAWKGTKNGQLMALIEQAAFECLVTCDKNLPYQQNLSRLKFAIVVLPSPRFEQLKGLVDNIAIAIANSRAGEVSKVTA